MTRASKLTVKNAKKMARNFLSVSKDIAIESNPTGYKAVLNTLGSYIGRDNEIKELYTKLRYG